MLDQLIIASTRRSARCLPMRTQVRPTPGEQLPGGVV